MRNPRVSGLILMVLLLVGIGIAVILQPAPAPKPAPTPTATLVPTEEPYTQVKILGGLIFQSPEIVTYFHDKYRIDITEVMTGSFAQAEADLTGVDCTHPAGASATDYFTSYDNGKNKKLVRRSDTVFQSFITVFTWAEYIPTLENAGLVTEEKTANGVKYFIDMNPILKAKDEGKNWKDIGINIPGPINFEYTDPLKSSSGLIYTTLMADYLIPGGENGGKVVTKDNINDVIPFIYRDWELQGNQVDNSPALFTKFVRTGAGMPFVVNYESQYIETVSKLPDSQKEQAKKIVGLYPKVTINTDHVLISLTPACERVAKILLEDDYIRQFAWSKLGMRNGAGGIEALPGDSISVPWLATSVQSMPEPKKEVVDAIKAALK